MRNPLIRLALAGAAVTALTTGAAFAEAPPAPPPPPAPPEAPMPPPPPPMPPMMMAMHHGHFDPERRTQRLRDVLQLRADQDGALKAYVEATSPKIVEMKKDVAEKAGPDKKDGEKMVERKPMTTLERLDHMQKAADAMQKRIAATRAFYTALSPSQQKTFDVLGMGDEFGGGDHFEIHRFETRGAPTFQGERKVVIERKVG